MNESTLNAKNMQTIIIHLDMNSYFATVEQQDNLSWRGKPVGVCEHLGGIIIAASVEAKRWGIKTGTPVWEARKLYPKIILTKTHPAAYRFYIKKVLSIASDYTGFVEQASIDEMYLDITASCNIRVPNSKTLESPGYIKIDPFEEAVNIAQIIKRRMKTEAGDYITCSIGIAENKLLAKIASDMQKPDGLVVVAGCGLPGAVSGAVVFSKDDLYQKLKLTDIPGIGHRQEKNLRRLGIKTLLELKNYPLSRLVARFGINGYHLHKMGRLEGSWKPAVKQEEEIKSIGHMYTLPKEYREKKFFTPVLYKLCEMVARRLRKQGLMGNILHFYIRDKNYESFGKSLKLDFYIYDGREIFLQIVDILDGLIKQSSCGSVKLIGVTIAGLRPYINQLSLFGQQEKNRQLILALDQINAKYGDFTICRVPILAAKEVFQDSIGFGRIKEKNI